MRTVSGALVSPPHKPAFPAVETCVSSTVPLLLSFQAPLVLSSGSVAADDPAGLEQARWAVTGHSGRGPRASSPVPATTETLAEFSSAAV